MRNMRNVKLYTWYDTTGYSRSPTTYSMRTTHLCITVHRHIDNPGKWHLSCRELGFDRRELESDKISDAKTEAVTLVKQRVLEWTADVSVLLRRQRGTKQEVPSPEVD